MLGIFKIGSPEFFFLKKKVSSASAENLEENMHSICHYQPKALLESTIVNL
jgi:hypothetical protein